MSLSAVEFEFLKAQIDRAMTQIGMGNVEAPEYSEHTVRDIVMAREALDAIHHFVLKFPCTLEETEYLAEQYDLIESSISVYRRARSHSANGQPSLSVANAGAGAASRVYRAVAELREERDLIDQTIRALEKIQRTKRTARPRPTACRYASAAKRSRGHASPAGRRARTQGPVRRG